MKNKLNQLKTTYRWLVQPLLVVGILLLGYFGAKGLTMFKQEPPERQRITYAPLVKILQTSLENRQLVITGNGTIEARTRINIVPQVGGRVTRIHPQLRAGGYFNANEVLLEIERIDYELAVTSASSEVASARRSLQVEQAEADAAIQEWNTLHAEEAAPLLVSREPQIAETKANLQAAKARFQQARINLKRTHISMPFTGRVVQASVDVGEVINANQSLGIVYGNELFEIPIPLEVDQLAWLDITNQEHSSPVTIIIPIAAQTHHLSGQLIRVESELDSVSRMARVVISLKATDIPVQLREEIIPGLFVDVQIQAQQLNNVTVLPAGVVREGGVMWTLENTKIVFVKPDIIYQADGEIWLRNLPENTIIINSSLDVVTEGMQVRIAQSQK
jgi:RND family efflux transporter MFP subunit